MWIDGVSVTLSSGAATTTSGGGYFSFLDVEGGTYTITISGFPGDASFDATTAEVTIAQADQSVTANFSGSWIRTASLMGMVTVEGEGLPGITVSISGRQDAQMLTDDNGQYTFTGLRAGNYTVEISGFDATDVAFSATSSAVMVSAGESKVWSFEGTFVRESAISGQVAVEGNGLSGVTVSLQGMGADEEQMTDAGGQYTFSNLRAGEYQLAISGYDTDEYGFSTTSATVRVEHGRTANVPFEGILLRTASIMGQVSVEGEGLAEVTVSLSGEGENQTTMTDNSGQYAFTELPAGNFQVGISGYDTGDYSFETTSKNVAVALGGTATVPFDGILLRTSGIAGRVSVDGMGLGDVTVTLTGGDLDDAVTAMTDATGQYAIAGLAAGDYTVAISGYNAVEYAFTDSQDVTLAKDATAIVNFTGRNLRTAAVSVMVTADGVGVPGVAATLIHVTNLVTQSGDVIAVGATGADGSHMFSDLLAGTYAVQISGTDEEIDFATTTLVAPVLTDQTAEVTFPGAINRTASIGGSVTVDGAGMGSVMVALSGGDDNVSTSMETGGDGSYSFTGLRRGDYTVSITNPDDAMYNFASTSSDVSLGVGQAQGDVSFAGTQVRTSSISGQVNVEGDALGGVTVMLAGAMEAEQTTGDDGLYAFRNLGSGSYTVSIANPDDAAYNFESMSMDFDLGNNDAVTHNFSGMHTRDGSISGMLYVDEGTDNDLYDEGEHALMAAGVEVVLVGPRLLDRTSAMTDSMGAFAFDDLRQGSYQVMPAAPGAAVMDDYMYGGAASNAVELGVAEDATQNLPYDITHQTVNFSVNLKSGEDMGDALPGATVSFFSDLAGAQMIGDATTDADGMASLRFARSGGNTVYASVAAPEGDYHTSGAMQAVMWDAKYRMTDASNEADIVNAKADFSFSGATITTDAGGGMALGGWAISVTKPDSAGDAAEIDGAPGELGADGSASYSEVVDAGDLPVTYTVMIADNQDNELDGGSKYDAGDGLEYTHDGLSLPATMDAGMMEVMYTTQTLKVYVHHELDQVMGYTGNVLGGDKRVSGMLDVDIRYIDATGRSRAFPSTANIGRPTPASGVYTFTNVPADHDVIVTAEEAADDIMLLDPDERAAYTDDDGATGGMFGDHGGFSHTVELCPLMATDPTGQDHGECGTFAFVSTYSVSGLIWKRGVVTSGDDFAEKDPVFVAGQTVSLDPVEGKNLVDKAYSQTTTSSNVSGTPRDDRVAFDFGHIASGAYKLSVPNGWRARMGGKGAEDLLGDALNPLAGDLEIDVTPTTATVYGRVKGDDGFPLDSVTVTINGKTAETDEYGRYIVDGIAAQTRKIGSTTHTNMIFVDASRAGFDDSDTEVLNFLANSVQRHDFAIEGTDDFATVSGQVTVFGSGAAVKGVEIRVNNGAPMNPNSGPASARIYVTNDAGSYEIKVPPTGGNATSTISAHKNGYTFTPASLDLSTPKDASISGINFVAIPNSTIRGRVQAPGGGPLSGVNVTATGANGDDTDVTSATGAFSLNVPAGTYTVAASAAGYTFTCPSAGCSVTVNLGQDVSFGDFESADASEDATLSALVLSDVPLVPTFASGVVDYTATVANSVASTMVTATATDDGIATVEIAAENADGDEVTVAGSDVPLGVGVTVIKVTVTAEDGVGTQTYTVRVTRNEASADATLSALSLADGDAGIALDPEFASDVDEYTAEVGVDVDMVTVSATANDAEAEVAITPADADSDDANGHQVTLGAAGTDTDITVTVTAEDGTVGDPYTVTVSRSDGHIAPSAPRDFEVTPGDQSATMTWTAPLQIGSTAITGYDWEARADGQLTQSGTLDPETSPATDGVFSQAVSNLVNGATYTFTVWAVNTKGTPAENVRGPAATATAKAQPSITLTPATGSLSEARTDTVTATVSLSAASIEDVVVTVAEVVDADNGAQVMIANDGIMIPAGRTTPVADTDPTTILAIDDVLDDDAVGARVVATSTGATMSDTLVITITDNDEVPGAPRNLTVTAGDTQLTLEWISPVAAGTSNITHYQYRISAAGEALAATDAWVTAASGVVVPRLTNDSAYAVEVRAVSAAGPGTAASGSGTPTG